MIDSKYKHFNIIVLSQIDIQIAHYGWISDNRKNVLWYKCAYELTNNPTKHTFINNNDDYEPITRIFLE
jgi:hypothetical protein